MLNKQNVQYAKKRLAGLNANNEIEEIYTVFI